VLQWEAARQLTSRRPAHARQLWWQSRFELAIQRRDRPLVAPADQLALLSLLTLANRRGSLRTVLSPVFSHRQLQLVSREAGARVSDPVAGLTVEQWATIAAAMAAVVHPSRWPRRRR
jgi:hypothetical protein